MTERELLADIVETTLQNIDPNYRVEQRLRRETFDATSRQKRLEIMGRDTTYAEVLLDGIIYGRNAANNSRRSRSYRFKVNVWYGYKDSRTLADSSQAVFDRIVAGEDGLLITLKETGSVTVGNEFFYVDEPENPQPSEVALSNDGKELAHYLTFTVEVRQHKR